jgi:hypothetical protein
MFSWTELNDLNTARTQLNGAGTNTAALAFGGSSLAATELWNGTNWSNVNSLSTGNSGLAGLGTSTAALAAGGYTTVTTAATEEWDGTGFITRTITTTSE